MKERIEQLLKTMLNKKYRYGSATFIITDYDFNEKKERLLVYTDRKPEPYDRPMADCMEFLKSLQPVDEKKVAIIQPVVVKGMMLSEGGLGVTLKDTLLDNIKKIQENPAYIPQAEAITNNVNSLINLAKVEVDFLKTLRTTTENI